MGRQIRGRYYLTGTELYDMPGRMIAGQTVQKAREHAFHALRRRNGRPCGRRPIKLLMRATDRGTPNGARHGGNQLQLLLSQELIFENLDPQHIAASHQQ